MSLSADNIGRNKLFLSDSVKRHVLLHNATNVRVCDDASDFRDYKENGETKTETTYSYSEFIFFIPFDAFKVIRKMERYKRSRCFNCSSALRNITLTLTIDKWMTC